MSLIIDGYNLMYASGLGADGRGAHPLERSRAALLGFLAAVLPPEELPRTIVVFDAQDPPPDRPRSFFCAGITVQFPRPRGDADTLIEELIRADTAPRQLTVVSSDHRLQKAARRRRARAVDSDVWYHEVLRNRRQREAAAESPAQPPLPLLEEDVDYWLRQFGGSQLFDIELGGDPRNPFPPGYGDEESRGRD